MWQCAVCGKTCPRLEFLCTVEQSDRTYGGVIAFQVNYARLGRPISLILSGKLQD